MFLAPLNYDRFFKKIFSDEQIAKQFLEDFLEITIQEIELLPLEHKLTNESSLLSFDYRCKVDGQYIIVDMQQWYKQDVIPRFYLYHATNTVLQLEALPLKNAKREKKIKDYSKLAPVITLIWMVHDNLDFIQDYTKYGLLPSNVEDFLINEDNWTKDVHQQLLEKREELLQLIHNDTKDLLFLKKNQLIFAFQRNIVNNHKDSKQQKLKPYVRWFEFAAKTLDKDNEPEDFKEYEADPVFGEIIRKLSHISLNQEDYTYIDYYEEFEGVRGVLVEHARKEGMKEGRKEGRKEEKTEIAINCLEEGMTVEQTSRLTGLTVEYVQKLKERLD